MAVHLFVRSSFTLLDSAIRIPEMVHQAKQMGYTSIGLADHNVLYGFPTFAKACRKEQMHPLFGMEADVKVEDSTVPFLLLAENNLGYQNLITLSSLLNNGSRVKGLTYQDLQDHSLGLVVIAYGEGGWADQELVKDDKEGVLKKLRFLQEHLPSFEMAISFQDASLWVLKNRMLKECCRMLQIKTTAVHKIYYLKEEDALSYQILTAIRRQKTIKDHAFPMLKGRWLLDPAAFARLYDPEDLEETDAIAARCRADLNLPKTSLPAYPVPAGLTSDQLLTRLCLAGLRKRRDGKMEEPYKQRLHQELDTISRMHFADYFLIVYDFIRYARQQGIYVGPGRGSACGSLVAYCLGITMVDPLAYHLLFERFLNPERVTMPDIDTDFPDNRRQEVIDYVVRRYGADHTAGIVTFGTLGARQVLIDTAKAMEIPGRKVESLLRSVPRQGRVKLGDVIAKNTSMQALIQSDAQLKSLVEQALKLEGLPRSQGVHPAGIVLSSRPLSAIVPTQTADNGMRIIQYGAEDLEERGLIKMDFLSLRNLTMIDQVARQLQARDPSFNIYHIPLDNPATYEVFSRGDTVGVFQFESAGMKKLLRRLQPRTYNDLVAALALYRPASADSIDVFLANRAHPERIRYLHEKLEPILGETYGVMLYQEQAMMTARVFAGFSLGRADSLRKAISKKKEDSLQQMQGEFMNGCRRNGYSEDLARQLWVLIARFGGYGFNKSHAVAYALIAYQTAWLKANDAPDFYAALLDSVIGDEGKTAQYIDECRHRGLAVIYPSVMTSGLHYQRVKKGLQLPLPVVHGIGVKAAETLVAERAKRPFQGYFDFIGRMSLNKFTEAQLEALISAGALDGFGETRASMLASLPDALSYADLAKVERDGQWVLDPGLISEPMIKRVREKPEERSERERQALGFSLGPHPILALRRQLNIHLPSLAVLNQQNGYVEGFALVASLRPHRTRRGEMMAYLTLRDETGEMDLTVMPRTYEKTGAKLVKGAYIRFTANRKTDGSCIAERLEVVK
jgi:DNA polymerase-3 subunit alpha